MRYAFGDCILDSDTRQVARAGCPMHLGPKVYELLQVLMAARPRVLSKLEILQQVWPGTAVTESSLSTLVAELREVLGDTAREPRYIRTVYGFGYAFVPLVAVLGEGLAAPTPPPVHCCLFWGDRRIDLPEGAHVIGRASDVLVPIDDPAVSRHHARITVSPVTLTLEDLGSRNGTSRNGQRLTAMALLGDGDTIGIGPVRLRVVVGPADGAETLAGSGFDAAAHNPAAVHHDRVARDVAARG